MGSLGSVHLLTPSLIDANTINGSALDATDEKVVAVFYARKTGNIRTVRGLVTGLNNGGGNPVYDVRVETVDGSTGFPTGTLWGTNTNASLTVTATGEWVVTLTADAAVTEGDCYAVVVNAVTVGGTQQATFSRIGTGAFTTSAPYSLTNTSGSFAKGALPLGQAPFYDDGDLEAGALALSSLTVNEAFTNASTPDERGNLFNFTDSVDVGGIVALVAGGASAADFQLVMYDAASTAVKTRTFDAENLRSTSADGITIIRFPAITIAAGANFRLVLKPSTTSNARLGVRSFATSAIRGQHFIGQYTARTDAGAWSETDTKIAMISPIIVAVNTSGGLLTHPGMAGGLRG